MRLTQDSTWREVLAEEAPKPPYLVIIMNVGVHPALSRRGSQVGCSKGDRVEAPPHSCRDQTLHREGCHT